MFAPIFHRCWLVIIALLFTATPLWAQEELEARDWLISYAVVVAFLGLIMLILLRPTKRNDSAFSFDEQKEQQEEEMKKIKGGH